MITLNTSDDPVASIIILSQDNLRMLRDCLASLSYSIDASKVAYEVVVLFQQTSDRSIDQFLAQTKGVRDLRARLNLGFGGGVNFAERVAKGKYIVLLNDDAETRPGWLSALVSAAESDDQIGAVGSRILFPDGSIQEAGVIIWSDASCYPLGRGEPAGSLAYSYSRSVDYASANGMLVRRRTFQLAGGFDDCFFPGYYEDVDLCMTIRHELGQRIVYEPRSVILHRESVTANRDPQFRSFLFRRHQAKLNTKWAHILSLYPPAQPESKAAIVRAAMRPRGNPKQVLVLDDRVPHVGMGSGFGRTADLLEILSAEGFAVSFAPTDRRHLPVENPLGVLGVDLITAPLADHLAQSERSYDIVIISRPHNFQAFYAHIRTAMPHAPVIYDVEALYFRRLELQSRFEPDAGRHQTLQRQAETMRALEEWIARQADRLVAVSDSEMEWLESVPGHAPVDFMRPLSQRIVAAAPDLNARAGAIFAPGWLGGHRSPNVKALQWYVANVLPLVRSRIPSFVTYVSGGNPPLRVQSMTSEGLVLLGFIDSVAALYAGARIAIAPILAGAGVKIKTIEALEFGVPVVATRVGAEGLGLRDGEEIDIADDAAEFAERMVALAVDDALWKRRRVLFEQRIAQWRTEQTSWKEVVQTVLDTKTLL